MPAGKNSSDEKLLLKGDFDSAVQTLKEELILCEDLRIRMIDMKDTKTVFFYLQNVIDEKKLNEFIIDFYQQDESPELYMKAISSSEKNELCDIIDAILSGSVVYFSELSKQAKLFTAGQNPLRSITEPESESIVRGAHDGFVESLDTNIQQIRYHVQDHNLAIHYVNIGEKARSRVALMYIEDIADPEIVKEMKRRLSYLKIDSLLTPGIIEEAIEDNSFSLFPQVINTERPDKVKANIMEGCVILMMDGSPSAIIAPITFFSFFQSPDDYSTRWVSASVMRILRFLAFSIAITLPAFYISLIAFHFEVIPNDLIVTMKNSIVNIPFPPLVEAMIMEITIELIREAGVRLPKPISQTIGIVGGLVIGDAVVQAGLISNMMIIVVAVTAVSSFVLPSYEMSTTIRTIRFPLMFLAASFGFIGIGFGFGLILMNLCKLESLGIPYLSPLSPFHFSDLKDAFIRLPSWLYKKRPVYLKPKAATRLKNIRGWKKDEK
ncbi:spore germination protein [Bacillus atrophaeus]|uniref:spore germination protein n=1 Tax=Bacillus atrophaeus TaxID=1452 RepID=UPI002E1F48C7|nr:spore germination protein [Bacillus atrophaeus]MED1031962.1 spore germination protein [Bacillus atrophaeus]MED1119101.1 spore germination protein [Bacillus atrophaeus]MED1130662.1 spore germination protein [Bacillus atrophaeus]